MDVVNKKMVISSLHRQGERIGSRPSHTSSVGPARIIHNGESARRLGARSKHVGFCSCSKFLEMDRQASVL